MRGPCVLGLCAAALCAASSEASAQDVCVNPVSGVPGSYGEPPLDWWGAPSTTPSPDDARWVGASGHSLTSGSASAPVELRTVWADVGTERFLYASWQFYVDTTLEEADHVLYLGLQSGGTSRVVRLRFQGDTSTTPITYCARPGSTQPGCGTASAPANYFTVFAVDFPIGSDTCGGIDVAGPAVQRLAALASGDVGTDLAWLTTTTRYFREPWAGSIDRWTVQMRIPVIAATTDLVDGIASGTLLSYQAQLEHPSTGQLTFERFPRDPAVPEQFCTTTGLPSTVFIQDKAAFAPIAVSAGLCSGDLHVDRVGVASGGVLGTMMPTAGTIDLGVEVRNESATAVAAGSLIAQFRIANWGVQNPTGSWIDVPHTLPASDPAATGHAGEAKSTVPIPARDASGPGRAIVTLSGWDLGPDEECQYTWQQATHWDAAVRAAWFAKCRLCDDPSNPGADDGAERASGGVCLPARYLHQCVAAEIRGGNLSFGTRSRYSNLNFAPLSVHDEHALIDVRGLPTIEGQVWQDIYFIVMPRNMPRTTGGETYPQIIAGNAARMAEQLAAKGGGDNAPEAIHARQAQLRDLAKHAGKMENERGGAEALVMDVARTLDTETLAHLVPTLEVYAYYRVPSTAGANRVLAPLTSFAVVTHHDGPVNGFFWSLDGAEHVGGNIYRTQVPVEGFRRLRVHVEAIEGPKATTAHDRNWPCGCCSNGNCPAAYQMGNAGLAFLALLWATRRRRRRDDEPPL